MEAIHKLKDVAIHMDLEPAEELRRPEAPGKWSILEVAHHLADSELAWSWRLRTVRSNCQVMVDGQLESVGPIHGSVLVDDGTVYCTAGRSSYLDGGLDLYTIKPTTGKVLSRIKINADKP